MLFLLKITLKFPGIKYSIYNAVWFFFFLFSFSPISPIGNILASCKAGLQNFPRQFPYMTEIMLIHTQNSEMKWDVYSPMPRDEKLSLLDFSFIFPPKKLVCWAFLSLSLQICVCACVHRHACTRIGPCSETHVRNSLHFMFT